MNALIAPGVALMYRMSNKGKMPLAATLFLLPLIVLYVETGANASAFTRIVIGVCVSLALYVMCAWYVQARDGFDALGAVIDRMADGDLTAGGRQEMGGGFRKLMDSLDHVQKGLGGIVATVRATANDVAQSAAEIAAANSHLSERTEQQASTLEQTAAAVEELARTVRQNAETCDRASTLARAAEETARSGAGTVHGLVERMAQIDRTSKHMADITTTIEAIAFQTNILALNAAVEAARAGERGRGFAVVAGEVRALSQRCAEAAHEIKALIQESVKEVRSGNEQAARAGDVIDQVVESVHEATELITRIAVASAEQSTSVGEVNQAIGRLDDMTQRNASLVQQGAANSRSLEAQAHGLRGLVSSFKIDEAPEGGIRRGSRVPVAGYLPSAKPEVSQ